MRPGLNLGILAVAAMALAALGGCQNKLVTIVTDPPGAQVTLVRLSTGGATPVPLNPDITPLTVDLSFADGASYRATARKAQHHEAQTLIEYLPTDRTEYRLRLQRFMVDVPTTMFQVWYDGPGASPRVVPVTHRAEAYIDDAERSAAARSCAPIDPGRDYGDFAALASSPTEDLLVYQVVRLDRPAATYTATGDQGLAAIAARHGTSVEDLRQRNPGVADPPKSGQVLRIADAVYSAQIVKQRVAGSGRTVLTDGRSTDLHPSFTFAGDSIVFSSNRLGGSQLLWRTRADGAGAAFTRITSSPANDYWPTAGPDGLIAYMSIPPQARAAQVWTVSPNGGDPTQLPDGESPAISPDGRKILFLRRDSSRKHRQLWVMRSDGGNQTQLTQNLAWDVADARWSPDGHWIACASTEGKAGDYNIWVMAADGGRRTQVTTNGSWDDSPCWDRAGKTIFFRSNRGGKWQVWRVEPVLP